MCSKQNIKAPVLHGKEGRQKLETLETERRRDEETIKAKRRRRHEGKLEMKKIRKETTNYKADSSRAGPASPGNGATMASRIITIEKSGPKTGFDAVFGSTCLLELLTPIASVEQSAKLA